MNTRKFKILCNGQLNGIIIISEEENLFPNCRVATIIYVNREGDWSENNLEIAFQESISLFFCNSETDEEIQHDLIKETNINQHYYRNFQILNF